jgi:hypothetical protein
MELVNYSVIYLFNLIKRIVDYLFYPRKDVPGTLWMDGHWSGQDDKERNPYPGRPDVTSVFTNS